MKNTRVLLVQLGANGDCLMVTTLARQIKRDFPGCHLTWAISRKCRQVIENNPDVDAVWDVDFKAEDCPHGDGYQRLQQEIEDRCAKGEFDYVFNTQIYPFNVSKFDGSTRSSMFHIYPKPICVDIQPVLRLFDSEVVKTRQFAAAHHLDQYKHVIILECAPGSKQSKLNQQRGLALAQQWVEKRSDIAVVVSTNIPFQSPHPRVIDGSCVSLRENVALSHYGTLFVGCSSGITWLLTSEEAKKLPMVLFLDPKALGSRFASVVYDFDYWGLPSDHIIETGKDDIDEMAAIVLRALDDFAGARQLYHETFKPRFWDFLIFIDYRSVRRCLKLLGTCRLFLARNRFGWTDFLDVRRLARVSLFLCEEAVRVLRKR